MKTILGLLILFTSVTLTSVHAQDDYYGGRSRKSVEYKECETNGDYLIKAVRKRWYGTKYGVSDLNQKDIFPAEFEKVYVFSNGGFLLFDGYKTLLVGKDFSIQKSFDGYIGESNGYFVAIGKINTQYPLEVFDLNGNSLLEKLKLDMNAGYYVSPLSRDEEKNAGLFIVTKEEFSGRRTAALFDVPNFRWVTEFGDQQFLAHGKGLLVIKNGVRNPRAYEYNEYYDRGYEVSDEILEKDFEADYYENGKKVSSYKNAYLMYRDILVCKNESGKFGAIDKDMKQIVPFEYDLPANFERARFSKCIVLAKGGESFVFDEKGTPLFNHGFQSIQPLARTAFQVQKNNKFGIINSAEVEIVPVKYDSITYASRYVLGKIGTTWDVLKVEDLNKTTTVLTGLTNVQILQGGMFAVQKDKKWALMSEEKNLSFEYDDIQMCGDRMIYKSGDKYGFLSYEGKAASKALFEAIIPETENLYVVCVKGKYGVVELDGDMEKVKITEKIPAKYDFVMRDRNEYYYGGYGFIVFDRNTGKSEVKEVSYRDSYRERY